jgi:peptidyl-prolyl cis-trans isomerase A (cyclophilin A)
MQPRESPAVRNPSQCRLRWSWHLSALKLAAAALTSVTLVCSPRTTPQPSIAEGGREQPRGSATETGGVTVAEDDPLQGRFTLEEASKGVPGEGELAVEFHTSMGRIDCELWPERAPLTVANFVGLARGLRPWKSESGWVKRPFFDGTIFHRVVPDFVIQGGRPFDSLDGGPGYVIPDEVWQGAKHDEAGLLCMANDGPNTGGSQFFIMAGRNAPQLDGSFTIFGSCFQIDVVQTISRAKAFGEKPAEDVRLEKVVIKREPRW